METRKEYQAKIKEIINQINPKVLEYDKNEYWMYQSMYEGIEFYATKHRYTNTLLALQIARGLHDGKHRKLEVERDGYSYRLPYIIHPLSVCKMLMEIPLDMEDSRKDILLASALCHDLIEDVDFKNKGKELYMDYFLDPEIYHTVTYLSKRYDFTEQQEQDFFHNIETHELALLVKLSDRGNNVEDLYNMKAEKVYEYTDETDRFFLPMCDYALKHYLNHYQAFNVLRDKILSLTEVARIFVVRYSIYEEELKDEINDLRKENERLREEYKALWDGDSNDR